MSPDSFLCMRLMFSRNQDEVEVVKNELLKAGIAAEIRRDPIADAMGVSAVELWVQDKRSFFDASKLYARMQDRVAGRSGGPATKPKDETERRIGVNMPDAERSSPPHRDVNGGDSRHASEPRREELKHASSLLEKGITEMFRRESELAAECASLRSKVEELSQALAQGKGAFAREIESRAAVEKNQAGQISGLASALEREKQKCQQQLKSRDDSLKSAQEKLDSVSRLLQTQQAAGAALREEIVSLEMQRDEHEISLCNARTEALAEREARIASEERAEKAGLALEKQLVKQAELEQQMQAHLASLTSLFRRVDTKGASGG